MSLRRATKLDLDSAIQAGLRPSVPKSGMGLVLQDGRTRKTLINAAGQQTPAGKYFYSHSDLTPPKTFDFAQEPVRRGRSLYVNLLDGSQRAVSRFDAVSKKFEPTALGKKFFAHRKTRFTVLFPVSVDLVRKDGSVFSRDGDYMPSTAVDLGEIEVPASLDDAQQIAEVKRQAEEWLAGRDDIDNEKILLAGYETHRYDPSRPIQYNKLHFNAEGDPKATLHRPLNHGKPWAFNFGADVCEEALEASDGCVVHQLSKYIRLKGADKGHFTKEQLTEELKNAMHEEYEGDAENQDLLDQSGITAQAIRRVCEAHGISFQVYWAGGHLETFTALKSKFDAVCCIVWADHLYTVRTGTPNFQQSAKNWVMATVQRRERKTRGYCSWELFTRIQPGEFYSRDLKKTRTKLHEEYVCPKVMRNGMGELKQLRYQDCTVHAICREADVCVEFLAQLGRRRPHNIVYRGESFAGFMQQVFDLLCTVDPRMPPTFLERQAVLARSNGRCELCGDEVNAYQLDHHVPRTAFGKDEMGNLWCVCAACHKYKTASCDNQRINVEDVNPYTSRFNSATWRAFVEAPRPHQVVANLHQRVEDSHSPLYHVDIRSCRLHAITEANPDPIPIFSPIDEVRPMTAYHLGDYHWVEIPTSKLRSPLRTLVYDGPRWYSKAECKYLLEFSICTWDDFKLTLTATTHRPAKDLAQKLKFMQEVWTHTATTPVGVEWAGKRASKVGLLAKSALLALIGSWGRVRQFRYTTITTNHPDDCTFTGEVSTAATPGSQTFQDITWKQEVRSQATLLPLSLIARSVERLNVARCVAVCLKWVRPERILSIQVDAVVVQPPRKRARQLWEELESIQYNTVHAHTRRPLARFAGEIQNTLTSTERIFQLKQLDEPLMPGGSLEVVDKNVSTPEVPEVTWHVEKEPVNGADAMRERVVQHIVEGKSCLLTGGPGTGKSYLVCAIRDALREKGECVEVLAPSNAASRVVQGSTIHNFLTRISTSQNGFEGTLIIDEISMVSMGLCALLEQLHACGTRILCTGDFQQLPPVGNSWRGQPVASDILKGSALLWRWAQGTHFVLQRCRRSDAAHFRFYMSLPQSIKAAVAKVRAHYPAGDVADLHLTISHRKRRAVNEAQQASFSGGRGHFIPEYDGEAGYHAVSGTPLVGSCTGRGFVNGAFYKILHISGDFEADVWKVSVQDTLTEQVLEVSPEVLSKHSCLAWAVVFNRSQGMTCANKTVCLHDLTSPYFSRAHLYVGLSRVTNGNDIRIAA